MAATENRHRMAIVIAHLLKRTWDWLTPEDRVGDEGADADEGPAQG